MSPTGPNHWHQQKPSVSATSEIAEGRRRAELKAAADRHRMLPIPVPPFRDEADKRAALGAAVAVVAAAVMGRWPSAQVVAAVSDLLLTDGVHTRHTTNEETDHG